MSVSPQDQEEKKYKRSYKACLNCRTRKVKCDGWETDPPCSRCRRERKECIFVESRRGGQANVLAGRKRKAEHESESHKKIPANASINELWPQDVQRRLLSGSKLETTTDASPSSNQTTPTDPNSSDHFNSLKLYDHNKLPPLTALIHTQNGEVLSSYTRRMLSLGEVVPQQDLPPLKSLPLDHINSKPDLEIQKKENIPNGFSRLDGSNTGALQFLAKAAGNIARADQRDRISALERHNALGDDTSKGLISHSTSEGNISGINRRPSFPPVRSTSSIRSPSLELPRQSTIPPMISHQTSGTRITMPPLEDPSSVRPRPSSKLAEIEYIGENSILTESAARKFINLFFSTMHPFFPHIPPDLMDPDVLAGYPILLCAVLTISSRYHSFEELNGKNVPSEESTDSESTPKHIEVHERLWVYCQRLISQTVWAEASTRSIGTVFAFLLFTEWNPRAIHWRWADYANADDPSKQPSDANEDGVAGLGAMRRSARMGWMLIGSAVRLAQDMGFMDNSSRIFLACHVSETFAAMNVSKRSMLSSSLSEIDLDSDDEDEDEAQQTNSSSKPKRKPKNKEADEIDLVMKGDEENLRLKTDTKLKFSRIQKAKIELLQIMSICYETLYGGKPKLDGSGKRENLAVLNIMSPLLENWHRAYKDLLIPTISSHYTLHSNQTHSQMIVKPQSKYTRDIGKQMDIESLIFDYHYARLYIYSLALTDYSSVRNQSSKRKKSNQLRLDELTKSSKYVELAFIASKEMLASTQRLHKIRMLKYMPVRWVTRIVRAVAFVVKCYLTITAAQNSPGTVDSSIMSLSIIPLDEIISIIQKVAITLREASPDELHLCTRYSTILMYLCSEMKSKIASKSTTYNFDYESQPLGTSLDFRHSEDQTSEYRQSSELQAMYQNDTSYENYYEGQSNSYDLPQDQNKNQKLDEELFSFPTDTVFDWFKNDNGGGVGLDFVEPWTEMIEQQINISKIDQ